MKRTSISLNNSGGFDWLSQKDLTELKRLGWRLEFFSGGYKPDYPHSVERDLPEEEARQEFEQSTGFTTYERGCDCCGQPFNMSEEDVTPEAEEEEEPETFWARPETVDAWRRLIGEESEEDGLDPQAQSWLELGQ